MTLSCISFPNEYFSSPNKSIPTATTSTNSKASCYYHLLHLYYLILKSIGKFSFFFGVWEFARVEKVKLFTEFLTVFFFCQWLLSIDVLNWISLVLVFFGLRHWSNKKYVPHDHRKPEVYFRRISRYPTS